MYLFGEFLEEDDFGVFWGETVSPMMTSDTNGPHSLSLLREKRSSRRLSRARRAPRSRPDRDAPVDARERGVVAAREDALEIYVESARACFAPTHHIPPPEREENNETPGLLACRARRRSRRRGARRRRARACPQPTVYVCRFQSRSISRPSLVRFKHDRSLFRKRHETALHRLITIGKSEIRPLFESRRSLNGFQNGRP